MVDTSQFTRSVSRREFVAGTSAVGTAALAGCLGGGSSSNGGSGVSKLEAGGSSTVYPIINDAGKYWNANKPPGSKYWPASDYGIDTEKNLSGYWGGLYGFSGDGSGNPPYKVSVSLSHSGTGVEKLKAGQIDVGNSSAPVKAEKPGWKKSTYDDFTNHVVGVDGQPIVVSKEIYEDGVRKITGQELKDVYKGRITNWKKLGGPDEKIQVLGRAKGSGTQSAFVTNVFGNPKEETQVDNRFGQNQRLAQAIKQADNAISYLALAFVDTKGVKPIALNWKGTTYAMGDPEHGLGSKEYPLSRDLHAYTWKGTSKSEAAFLRMVVHDFGQETFVKPNNYFALPKSRQRKQLEKLPDPTK